MLLTPSSFMYAVSTAQFKNVIELCHVEMQDAVFNVSDKISFLISNYLLHQRKFEKVNICFFNHEFTMIPQVFANDEEIKPFLQFATGSTQVRRTFKHHLKNLDFCYTVEQELIQFFERTFSNSSIRHLGAVSIDLFFGQHSLKNANLYLSIGDHHIEIAAKQKNELLLYNAFNVANNEDVLYYLLFAMEQFQLNPQHVRLCISGERPQSDELIKSIRKYIKQVDLCVTDASVNLNGELSSLPRHYYFTLLNQHLCEL